MRCSTAYLQLWGNPQKFHNHFRDSFEIFRFGLLRKLSIPQMIHTFFATERFNCEKRRTFLLFAMAFKTGLFEVLDNKRAIFLAK
jgi:hypothetical protein